MARSCREIEEIKVKDVETSSAGDYYIRVGRIQGHCHKKQFIKVLFVTNISEIIYACVYIIYTCMCMYFFMGTKFKINKKRSKTTMS